MLTQANYALEHFYYGQLFYQGKPQGELRLLASSPGVRQEHVSEAMQEARVPPMPNVSTGSWALVRGKSIPFLMAQAQIGSRGQAMRHVILIPIDVLRSLGGNLNVLTKLVEAQMPVFEQVGGTIPLLNLTQAGLPDAASQENAMLALMTATRDRMDVIESLLAALIQGVQIVVKNAPPDLYQRVSFMEGLLALLPPPARFGVTFATYTRPSTRVDAQIRFFTDDAAPPNSLVYLWDEARIEGKKVEDEYSRFIKSQLRLDTGLVIQQTTALTSVASWRIKRGDTLADALKYAAHRLKLDTAITNNQPVESNEVAKILAEDPTLTDELRAAYVRHLLAFALVLEEIEHADLLAVVVRGQPDLERVVLAQMSDALNTGKADRVYRTLSRWLSNPLGLSGMYWVELAQRAATAYAELLVKNGQIEVLNAFLRHCRRNRDNIEVTAIIPRLVEIGLPHATNHKGLAETIFTLAAASLPANRWQRFVALKPVVSQLPDKLKRCIGLLTGEIAEPPGAGAIVEAASALGDEWKSLLVLRLTELALLSGRLAMIDSDALKALVSAANTPAGKTYDGLLRWLVRSLSADEIMMRIGALPARALLQILLVRGAYDDLANELLHQARVVYATDKPLNYAAMIRSLFLETPVPVERIPSALKVLSARGIKPLPLTLAYFGALEQHQWSPDLDSVAAELTTLVFSNRLITEALQLELVMQLLQYHIRRRDMPNITRTAALAPLTAAKRGDAGVTPMITLYRALDWDDEARKIGMDALRKFIRRCSDTFAPKAISRIVAELGDRIGHSLEATHALRRLLGGEELADYAYSLHTTAQFLYDTALTYVTNNRAALPSVPGLLSDLDGLNGGLNDAERRALSSALLDLARTVLELAQRHRKLYAKEDDAQIDTLLMGEGTAQSAFDIFRVMGGYFSRGRRLSARTDRLLTNHPLADRSAPSLMREIQQINRLLKAALRAFPADEKLNLSAASLREELDNLWSEITLHERRRLVRDLSIDLQRIPELSLMIIERSDARVVSDNGGGTARRLDANRQQPQNTLEFYRFVHGYFKRRIRVG